MLLCCCCCVVLLLVGVDVTGVVAGPIDVAVAVAVTVNVIR